jgi:FtsP/CotA-like multicopper oxidase with cupredoxin domain
MRNLSRRELIIGGAAATAAVSLLGAEGCSHIGGVGSTPGIPGNLDTYTLTAQYSTHTLNGTSLRLRTYDGIIPGPTMYALPGQPFNITVNNNFPADPPATPGIGVDPINNPHLFNTTNLHVHGVQIVPHIFEPVGTTDPTAMMVMIAPGTSKTYNFVLPIDHPSGLYWYHPHHHGSTDIEVSGGMAGLILVGGPIDQVPEIAAARDIHVAVQSLSVNVDATDPSIQDLEYVAYQPPASGGYKPRSKYEYFISNGQLINLLTFTGGQGNPTFTSTPFAPPSISMQPGEIVRVRLLNGTNENNLALVLPGFELYVIGQDGVNLLAPRLLDQSNPANNVFLTNAGRIEMLLRAPATAGTYKLSGLALADPGTHPWPQFDLLSIVVGGSAVSMNIPAALPTPTREYPLIAQSEIVGDRTVDFNSAASTSVLPGTVMWVNGVPYAETSVPPEFNNMATGTAEQWTISNEMPEGHPFHLHTNSFEVISSTVGGVTTPVTPPTICDTVWIPPMGSVVIRVRYKTWKGKDVFHCHKLTHEDQGMMANTMLT